MPVIIVISKGNFVTIAIRFTIGECWDFLIMKKKFSCIKFRRRSFDMNIQPATSYVYFTCLKYFYDLLILTFVELLDDEKYPESLTVKLLHHSDETHRPTDLFLHLHVRTLKSSIFEPT